MTVGVAAEVESVLAAVLREEDPVAAELAEPGMVRQRPDSAAAGSLCRKTEAGS